MFIYFFATAISLIFAHLSQRSRESAGQGMTYKKNNNILRNSRIPGIFFLNKNYLSEQFYLVLSFLPLYLISALRYMVGTDYATTYKQIYYSVYSLGYHIQITGENLYKLLNRIAMIYSGSDYVGVFALSSLMICGFIFAAIRKQSASLPYSVLIFIISGFYFWSFNAVRQMIAMSIFLYSLQYIQKRQILKYFVCILFATGFHTTAILYLPFYFINKFKISFKTIILLSFVFITSPVLIRNFAYIITSEISILNIYALRYFDISNLSVSVESSSVHTYINLLFLVLYVLIAELYDKKHDKCNIWIAFQFLAFAFASLSNAVPVANRISRLFAIVQIISIPIMTNLISKKLLRSTVNTAIVIFYSIYCIVTYFVLGYHNILPYSTIFNR